MCFDFLYKFFWNISHSKKKWARYYHNVYLSSYKVPLLLSDVNGTGVFSSDFGGKKRQISNFVKIGPVGVELFHAGGQTDMTTLIVAFRNFVNDF